MLDKNKYYEILNYLGNDSIKFELLELSGMFYIVKYNAQIINKIVKDFTNKKNTLTEEDITRFKTMHSIEYTRYQFDSLLTTDEQKEVIKNNMVINYLRQKIK